MNSINDFARRHHAVAETPIAGGSSRLLADVRTGTAAGAKALDDSQAREDGPDEEAKSRSSLDDAAVAIGAAVGRNVDSNGNGTGEPEERSDTDQSQADEGVVDARKEAAGEAGVEHDDE